VVEYNEERPHRSLRMQTPAERFHTAREASVPRLTLDRSMVDEDRSGENWVSRVVSTVGVITVSNQQFSVGRHRAGDVVDVHVRETTLEAWCGNELLKTVARTSQGEVRKKRAEHQPRRTRT
jgi:hypothetical protein